MSLFGCTWFHQPRISRQRSPHRRSRPWPPRHKDAVARSVQSWQDFVEVMPLRVGWPHAKRLWKPQLCLAASFRTGQSCHSRAYTTCPGPGSRIVSAVHAKRARDSFRCTVCLVFVNANDALQVSSPHGVLHRARSLREQRSEQQTETDFVPLRRSQVADLTCPCRAVRISLL